ncbi:unnamed protein product [Phyllotreta striolata]|uniref:Methylenetetrahydrofolate reductase (NAD(P)H) n=1 Tax=Phyllotreta striolata TaxID=444603 RepID=A0A9N9TLU5_PHYSR|nr:unnamed protein product [Phyllotreta striolata]
MRETLITRIGSAPFVRESPVTFRPDAEKSIKGILSSSDIRVSVELCPNRQLDKELLLQIPCRFCAITWFSPSADQLERVDKIPAIVLARELKHFGLPVLLHLAGRNLRKFEVLKILGTLKKYGIRNIFALQGDASQVREKDDSKCDFPYAADLVDFIRSCYGNFFTIGVAGYPDGHPNSFSRESEMEFLKAKVSRGADFILTQGSYSLAAFTNFIERCRSAGIRVPVVPGLFIISSYGTLAAVSKFCGVPVPKTLLETVKRLKENDPAAREFGITEAGEMVKRILANGNSFGGVHVFSLNNLELVREVLGRVGFYPVIERPLKLRCD